MAVEPGVTELYGFVWQRSQDQIRDAEASGDELVIRFRSGISGVLVGIRADLEAPGLAAAPALHYLQRAASHFRDHPDFPAPQVASFPNRV